MYKFVRVNCTTTIHYHHNQQAQQQLIIFISLTSLLLKHQNPLLYFFFPNRDALSRRHPCLPSVIKLVKNLMHWSNLNNAFTGGLSSYSIVLMCCAAHDNLFFVREQEQERSGLEKETVPEDQLAGKLFLHFLAMFSSASFDPTVFGIDLCDVANPSCLFRLSAEECANIGTSLWIRDPFATSKNVARPSFNFKHASLCFGEVLANLTIEHVKMIEEGDTVWDKTHFRPALFRFFLW